MTRRKSRRAEVRRVQEVLRLTEAGRSQTQISQSCRIARGTVRYYQRIAAARGLTSELVSRMGEAELETTFYRKRAGRKRKAGELDFQHLQRELTRKGVTRQLLWEEYLREQPGGYSYSRFCELYCAWRKGQRMSLRQDYKVGEKGLVDFAGMTVSVFPEAGPEFQASIFVGTLGASNFLYAEATRGEDLDSWLGAHTRWFSYCGGVPEVVVPDNLRSGVTKACFYDPVLNASYRELAEHYGITVIPTRSAKPRDKAKVEEAVQLVERRILAPLRNHHFTSLGELNAAVKELLEAANARQMQVYGCSRRELFEAIEKPALKPLPAHPFRVGRWQTAKVNIDYHIEVERRYYSVPYQLRGRRVEVCVRENTIEIYHEQQRVALHPVVARLGMHHTLKEHMPQEHRYMLDWSPSRFLSWAEKIGSETRRQIASLLESRAHPEQGYRACLGLLRMEKRYGAARLEAACRRANHFGIVSMRSIKSMLEEGHDRLPIEQPCVVERSVHGNVRGARYYQ